MSEYTMDPDRVELLERRCERLERMIRILSERSVDSRRRIKALESMPGVPNQIIAVPLDIAVKLAEMAERPA